MADNPSRAQALFLKHALEGNEEAALDIATPGMERAVHNEFICRCVADGYALLGRKADAIRWVGTAIDRGHLNYPSLAQVDVFLEPLHVEPEFQALMAELKPRWEALIEWERGLPE